MSAPFMQLYVADYLGDTRHLTTEQHGAYLLLLMTMWRAGGRLPNDAKKLSRIAGCTASRWSKICGDVMEFFDVEGADLVNQRLMFELEKAEEKSIKRAEAGTRGGRAKALKNKKPAVAIATSLPKHSSEPEPESEEDTEAKAPVSTRAPKGFDEFWSAYPVKKGKLKALEAYRRAIGKVGGHDPPGQLLAAVQRAIASDAQWARGYVPHPTTWLNAGGWLDEPQTDERPDHRQDTQPDARRANTDARRNAWADVVAERNGFPAGRDGDGGGAGGPDRDGDGYPRLAIARSA